MLESLATKINKKFLSTHHAPTRAGVKCDRRGAAVCVILLWYIEEYCKNATAGVFTVISRVYVSEKGRFLEQAIDCVAY